MVSLHSEGMSSFYNQIPVDMVVNIFTFFFVQRVKFDAIIIS